MDTKQLQIMTTIIVIGLLILVGGRGYLNKQIELRAIERNCDITITDETTTIVCTKNEK